MSGFAPPPGDVPICQCPYGTTCKCPTTKDIEQRAYERGKCDERASVAAAIDNLLNDIVCDYQCNHGRLRDGSWGWNCGCGNVETVAKIRALIHKDKA